MQPASSNGLPTRPGGSRDAPSRPISMARNSARCWNPSAWPRSSRHGISRWRWSRARPPPPSPWAARPSSSRRRRRHFPHSRWHSLRRRPAFPQACSTGCSAGGRWRWRHWCGAAGGARAVSFTGATRVGGLVARGVAASGIKKLALELGGNAPFIVTEDADLDAAVGIALGAKFQTSGQDCCAANRILVAAPLYERFVAQYSQAVGRLKVGSAFAAQVEIGPLIHQAAFDATVARVEDARAKGARITAGGRPHALGGWFFEPTVVADARPGMRIYDEENFAPIAAISSFATIDEVVALANDTEYGLAAYVCAQRIDTIFQLVRRLDFAMVSVNGVKFTGAAIPFGGMKASGLGREGGAEGFAPFVETKYFCLGNLGLPLTNVATC